MSPNIALRFPPSKRSFFMLFSSCGNTGELQSNKTSKRCEVSIFHKITSRTYKYVPHYVANFSQTPKLIGRIRSHHFSWESYFKFSTCLLRLSDSSLSNHSPLHRSEGFAKEWKGFAGMVNGLPVKKITPYWLQDLNLSKFAFAFVSKVCFLVKDGPFVTLSQAVRFEHCKGHQEQRPGVLHFSRVCI